MKVILYYFFNYEIVIIIGYLIKYIRIPNIFSLPYYFFIFFNYLAITFQIKNKLEVRKDIKYKKLLMPLIILTTIANSTLCYISYVPLSGILVISLINIAELLLAKPKYEKIEDDTKKYIDEYFENKK